MSKIKACSSVDRALDSDSESQGFDSLHAYELKFEKFRRFYSSNLLKLTERYNLSITH